MTSFAFNLTIPLLMMDGACRRECMGQMAPATEVAAAAQALIEAHSVRPLKGKALARRKPQKQ
jgi:hypothetical protein